MCSSLLSPSSVSSASLGKHQAEPQSASKEPDLPWSHPWTLASLRFLRFISHVPWDWSASECLSFPIPWVDLVPMTKYSTSGGQVVIQKSLDTTQAFLTPVRPCEWNQDLSSTVPELKLLESWASRYRGCHCQICIKWMWVSAMSSSSISKGLQEPEDLILQRGFIGGQQS